MGPSLDYRWAEDWTADGWEPGQQMGRSLDYRWAGAWTTDGPEPGLRSVERTNSITEFAVGAGNTDGRGTWTTDGSTDGWEPGLQTGGSLGYRWTGAWAADGSLG